MNDKNTETKNAGTNNWPELAISLYDKLTGRGAEITYEFENFEIVVPSGVGNQAEYAKWRVNGIMKLRARDQVNA